MLNSTAVNKRNSDSRIYHVYVAVSEDKVLNSLNLTYVPSNSTAAGYTTQRRRITLIGNGDCSSETP